MAVAVLCAGATATPHAQRPIRVAAASDLSTALGDIAAAFRRETG